MHRQTSISFCYLKIESTGMTFNYKIKYILMTGQKDCHLDVKLYTI